MLPAREQNWPSTETPKCTAAPGPGDHQGMELEETHEDQDMRLETSLNIVKVLRAVLRYFECNP